MPQVARTREKQRARFKGVNCTMNRYRLLAHLCVASFLAMVCILITLNVLTIELAEGSSSFIFMQVIGALLSLIISICGLYLWITGFKRFKHIIGNFGFSWLCYLTFTIFSGVYMQYRYGSKANGS